jgi:hypothetical protein
MPLGPELEVAVVEEGKGRICEKNKSLGGYE